MGMYRPMFRIMSVTWQLLEADITAIRSSGQTAGGNPLSRPRQPAGD